MIFSAILISISFIVCSGIVYYSFKQIQRRGFNCCTTFLLILVLFYTVIPLLYLIFENNRDISTAFNRMLASKSIEEISITMAYLSALILLVFAFYYMKVSRGTIIFDFGILNKGVYNNSSWDTINSYSKYKVERMADFCLLTGGCAIGACIFAVGGVGNYLALGSQARGLNKSLADFISPSFLPLITLSSIILAAPFLYKFLLNIDKQRYSFKIKFWVSFIIAVLYLLYNQGRLPLLLFFVPFLLDLKIAKKAKIGTLILVSIVCIFVLEPLSNLFTYITYGRVTVAQAGGFLDTLLLEFTYPFSNFINRSDLINCIGLRYGIDYIQWPLTVLPSSIIKVFGFSKSGIQTIGALNTDAYARIAGGVGGGIPTDFFTFNYYQLGIISLLLAIPIFAWLLRQIDIRINKLYSNDATRILSLRVCFLLVSMVNNFDPSVIFRMRFDFIIILWAIFYISKNGKRYHDEC